MSFLTHRRMAEMNAIRTGVNPEESPKDVGPSSSSIIARSIARLAELERENARLSATIGGLEAKLELFETIEMRAINLNFESLDGDTVVASVPVYTPMGVCRIEQAEGATAARAVEALLEKLEGIEAK